MEMFRELKILLSDRPDKAELLPPKPQAALRWAILIFSCLMLVGSYYCFDIPAALKTQIDDYFGDPSTYETYFSLLYSLYAFPNVILPFFGGYFVDKFGVRLCMLLFAGLITLGQVIVCIGVSIKSWPVLFIGRFVFGLGGESLTVALSALLADWFNGKELAFAFGLNLSVSRLGSVTNNILSPQLTQSSGLPFAMWFGAMVCGFSLFTVVLTIPIDKGFDELDADLDKIDSAAAGGEGALKQPLLLDDEHAELSKESAVTAGEGSKVEAPYEPSMRDVLKLSYMFWILVVLCVVIYGCVLPFNNIASSLLLERDYFIENPSNCRLHTYGCQSSTNTPISQCPTSHWYQPPLPYNVTIDGKYYSEVTVSDIDCTSTTWSEGCTSEYCDRLATGQNKAAVIMSIPYIISSVLSPLVGIAVDLYGLRSVIATIAALALIAVHVMLGFTTVDPIGPLVGQGLAYTGFASVLWPAIPLVVDEKYTGLAFGIATASLNLACAVFPIIIADMYNSYDHQYIPKVEELFVYLAIIGSVVGIYLNFYDYKYNGNILNKGLKSAAAEPTEEDRKDVTRVSVVDKSDLYSGSGPEAGRPKGSVSSETSSLIIGSPVGEPMVGPEAALLDSVWKSNYAIDNNRRAMSSAGPSPSLNRLTASADANAQNMRNRSVDQSSSSFRMYSQGGPVTAMGHSRHHKSHRQRGSSFTAYEQIHKGGGF